MSESKEVATKAETAVAIPKELLGSFVEDSGAGTENIGADDMKIPFLRIAQPLSPELNKKHENFIEGTEADNIQHGYKTTLWGRSKCHPLWVHQEISRVYSSRKGRWVPRRTRPQQPRGVNCNS